MDFTNYLDEHIPKFYGGGNGNKKAIRINSQIYMLKFPPFEKKKQRYTNSCISEYIACHIFASLGFDTQETSLGTVNYRGKEKIVVACKDFTAIGVRLQEFAEIKNGCLNSSNSGYGTELEGVLEAINEQEIYSPQELSKFFWDMFIADALLGNFDRHNGNWGFLINDYTLQVKLAPIYDCGSCLYPQMDDELMKTVLQDENELLSRIYVFPNSALKLNGNKINYYTFINSCGDKACNAALLRIYPKIDMNQIYDIIEATPFISELQKRFYKTCITRRYELILTPAYSQLQSLKEME